MPVGGLENFRDAGHFFSVIHLCLEAQIRSRFRLCQRVVDFKAGAFPHIVHGRKVNQHIKPGGIPQPADDIRHSLARDGQRNISAEFVAVRDDVFPKAVLGVVCGGFNL